MSGFGIRRPPLGGEPWSEEPTGGRGVVAPGRKARLVTLAVGWLALGAAAAGCAAERPEREARERARETGYRGILLPEPLDRPDFTLTDTRGEPFSFREETAGRAVLLFFGYTHCPDICPVQMANLAAVLADLPYSLRQRVRVVFVTTDPERDTPERLREWLDRFEPAFVGLRGGPAEVNRIQERLRLPPAVRQPTEGGGYLVGHASQVIAFSRGDDATVVYPAGTRQADWARDLPRLAGPPEAR